MLLECAIAPMRDQLNDLKEENRLKQLFEEAANSMTENASMVQVEK